MTPIPLPVLDIPTLWWWLVTPGVVLAAAAGVVVSRIEVRLSASRSPGSSAERSPAPPTRVLEPTPAAAAA